MQQIELATAKMRCFLETFGFLIMTGVNFGFVSSFMADIRALELWRARFVSFLAEKCEIVSASRRRSARDCRGAIVERVLWAVLVRGLAVGAEAVIGLAAVVVVRIGRAGVGMATGMAGVTGVIGAVKLIGVDVGPEILRGCGMEAGVGFATGAGAEKLSGAVTGAGAEKLSGAVTGAGAEISNGAEIWIREVVGRDFGTEVAGVLVGRMAALFLSDSRSESKEMVIFFAVGAGAGVVYEVGVD